MDNKKLNEQESLELITQMIQNTKFKMVKYAGTPFLVWGYMTVVTSLLVWYLLKETGNYYWQFLWLLMPAVSCCFSFVFMMVIPGHYLNIMSKRRF